MIEIRNEDKMDFIDPAEGNSHITAGSETDVKAKKSAHICVKTKITEAVVRLHQNDHNCHLKFLRQAVEHARDRVSLKSLPSNAKPVVSVFRQISHFQTGPKPTGSLFQNVMPSSGQKGPAGGMKPSVHQSFAPPFFLSPMFTYLVLLSLSLSLRPQESTPPPLPLPLPDPGQYDLAVFTGGFLCYLLSRCRLSSAAQRNGDSLDSRARPRADRLHPICSVSFILPNITFFFFPLHHPETL